MKDLTKEQFDILQKHKDALNETRAGCHRAMLMSDAAELNQVYADVYGKGENLTCGRCVLAMLQGLTRAYDKYIEDVNKTLQDAPKRVKKASSKHTPLKDENNEEK